MGSTNEEKEVNLTWSIKHDQHVVGFFNGFMEVAISQCDYTI